MKWAERVMAEWDATTAETGSTRSALVKSLSRTRWDLFWTQTFRRPINNAWAARNVWCRSLAEWCSSRQLTVALYALEPHADYRSLHVHALLSMHLPIRIQSFRREWRAWKNWSWATMGKALWLHVTDQTFVWYVTKYVAKMPKSAHWMTDYQRQTLKECQWGILTPSDVRGIVTSGNRRDRQGE